MYNHHNRAARAAGVLSCLFALPMLGLFGCGSGTTFANQTSAAKTATAGTTGGDGTTGADATTANPAGGGAVSTSSGSDGSSASSSADGGANTGAAGAAAAAGATAGAGAGTKASDSTNAGGAGGSTASASGSKGTSGGAALTNNPGGSGAGGSSGSASGGSAGGSSGSGSTASTGSTLPPGTPCSEDYSVPATANPYLAGEANGASINYSQWVTDGSNPIDTAPQESPVLVVPIGAECIKTGAILTFTVSGSITYNPGVAGTNANGNTSYIVSHELNALYGKSGVTAPINSLMGVFLTDADPTNAMAPAALDFSTQAERDYVSLAPEIGQIFFIGTGLTSTGVAHQVTVPAGATRLYFAVMDSYQWNNNVGTLTGAILAN